MDGFRLLAALAALGSAPVCVARAQQHDTTHTMTPGMKMPRERDTVAMPASDTMGTPMVMEGPLGISMERMGSGTTWIPDAVMLPSRHRTLGGWGGMLHGF